MTANGTGTPEDPWQLQTPPLSSAYTMHRDARDGQPNACALMTDGNLE